MFVTSFRKSPWSGDSGSLYVAYLSAGELPDSVIILDSHTGRGVLMPPHEYQGLVKEAQQSGHFDFGRLFRGPAPVDGPSMKAFEAAIIAGMPELADPAAGAQA